jgi:hypothetical protein
LTFLAIAAPAIHKIRRLKSENVQTSEDFRLYAQLENPSATGNHCHFKPRENLQVLIRISKGAMIAP